METELFLGFNLHAWITIVTVLGMFTTLLLTKLRADIVFLAAIGVLFVTGVLDAKEAFSGFSSTSVVVIGVLFVVVAGLTHTGVLQWIVRHLLGQPSSYGKAVVRLMLPVAGLSSLLSNTTVVAMFVGIVKMWSKKLGIAPSKLLIPLSYASGMGGVCTLIGTPPNLIISGLYADKTGVAMNVLATTLPGLFCLIIGVLSVIVMTAICLVGTFITEFISNTAAGAMFFPIMYEAAEKLGYEPYPFLIALMVSVSSSFATPIGSPTHMLVYGPGGYRFSDFMRIGLLMNFIILAANIFIVNIIYPLTPLQ